MIAARVSEELGISKVAVHNHILALEAGKYVQKVKGTKNPAIYEKAENSAMLDELVNPGVNPTHGGGPNEHYCGKPHIIAGSRVPTGEAHIAGRFIFPVLRIGDLRAVRVRSEGREADIIFFEKEPKRLQNGVMYHQGRVSLDDQEVKVQFWDTSNPAMHIWPRPVLTTAGTVATARERLEEKAVLVANILTKHGGWKLGQPEFVSNEEGEGIHYATNDPLITGNFPDKYVPANSQGYWGDKTPGPFSVETNIAAKGQAVLDFYGVTNRIVASNMDMMSKIDALMSQTAGLVGVTENISQAMVNLASVESLLVTKAAKESGVMFQ